MPRTSKRFASGAATASCAVIPALLLARCAAAAEPPLTAYVGKSGEVTIRRGDSESALATVKPGIFEAGWQYRGVSYDKDAGKPLLRATNAGATVAVAVEPARAEGKTLRLRYVMTPDKDVPVNSVHVSVNAPAGLFVGGKASVGATSAAVPSSPGATHLVSGSAPVTLEKGALSLTVSAEGGVPLMVQDGRVFNGADLEVRVGPQQERVWKAGEAQTFTLTVTLPQEVAVREEAPVTLAAGPEWVPLPWKVDVEPGSALDFSKLWNDAPAGKHGRVVARPDGHFAFEKKNAPQRFYGANLCFGANYLSRQEADALADQFARIGYNTVRIHHYEGELIDSNAPNSYTLRPDSLEKLDYLLAAFKKRGIYVKTDLFVSRPVKPAEMGLTEGGMDEFKAAVLVSPPAMENWKAFTRALLNHVNPHTGVAYKDEPALAWLSVVNEPNLTNMLGRLNGRLRDLYVAEWRTWLKGRYADDAALRAAWGDNAATLAAADLPKSVEKSQVGADVGAFLTHVHRRGYAQMRSFLRDEIGTKALLTDLNGWSETPAYMAARADLDWVDNHFYWDHPNFLEKSWQLPSEGGSGGRGAVETAGAGPNAVAMTRLYGKPFSVSEFNYSSPNRYRAEGGLLMGAAAALQDWDAVWRFAYAHGRDRITGPQPLNYFDVASDPAGMAGERAALMLFLRGDLKPAPVAVSLIRQEAALARPDGPPAADGFRELTLVTKVGTRLGKPNGAEVALEGGDAATALKALKESGKVPAANRTDLSVPRRESVTGELFVDGEAGMLQIDTQRTVGGVAGAGTSVSAGALTAKVEGTRAAVWASSLDGQPVTKSRRLLLVHLTDVQNTGMRYSAPDRRVLEDWGTLPHLARRGSATVTLARPDAAKLEAWRLDTSGKRVAPLPVKVEGGRAVLDLSTAAPDGTATLYYEVAVKP